MGLYDSVIELATHVAEKKGMCNSEEATKTSFILPFLKVLGYDIFDPTEVVPEVTRAIKGNDRVDYVIQRNNTDLMLIECKHWDKNLDNYVSQLQSYYSASDAKIGILTNGIEYRFYTETAKANLMDGAPFFVFCMDDVTGESINTLELFCRDRFEPNTILIEAKRLISKTRLHELVERELTNPSDDFVAYFFRKVHPRSFSSKAKAAFGEELHDELRLFIESRISRSLALQTDMADYDTADCTNECFSKEAADALALIQDILGRFVTPERITAVPCDNNYYYSIRLDKSQWRPICKLHLNDNYKWMTVGRYWPLSRKFYASIKYKVILDSISDISKYSKDLIDIMKVMLFETNEERIEWVNSNRQDWITD